MAFQHAPNVKIVKSSIRNSGQKDCLPLPPKNCLRKGLTDHLGKKKNAS